MIGGKVDRKPFVLEYLPEETTMKSVNQGYGMLILNKIEELEKNGDLITGMTIATELNIGKTTVHKHVKRLMKQGFISNRLAKVQMPNTTVIVPIYAMKKKGKPKNGKK
jgi:response regulator of citrate/malate metabolism